MTTTKKTKTKKAAKKARRKPATKKTTAKQTTAKQTVAPTKRYTRTHALREALKKGGTRGTIIERSDKLYVEHGGKSNETGARATIDIHLPVLVLFEVVEKDGDIYRLAK